MLIVASLMARLVQKLRATGQVPLPKSDYADAVPIIQHRLSESFISDTR
jgi:hypothetical protein